MGWSTFMNFVPSCEPDDLACLLPINMEIEPVGDVMCGLLLFIARASELSPFWSKWGKNHGPSRSR